MGLISGDIVITLFSIIGGWLMLLGVRTILLWETNFLERLFGRSRFFVRGFKRIHVFDQIFYSVLTAPFALLKRRRSARVALDTNEPPSRAEFMLLTLLPAKDRDNVTGDLAECYREVIKPKYGVKRAVWWYRFQALRSIVSLHIVKRIVRWGAVAWILDNMYRSAPVLNEMIHRIIRW